MRSFTIYDMFVRNATVNGHGTAIVEDKRRITFSHLLTQADWTASGMAGLGLKKGDRIAVVSLNHHRFFVLFGAASALGAMVVPVNWRLSEDEILFILKDSDPRLIFVDKEHGPKLEARIAAALPGAEIVYMDASIPGERCIDDIQTSDPVRVESLGADDPFCIIYTAAVDGKPRGAVLSHGNMIYGNLQTAATMGLTHKDAYLNMLPLFHITGLNLSFSVMHMGGKNVVIPKFEEKETLRQTEKEKISVWGSFPPILSRLMNEFSTGAYDCSSLRLALGLDGPDPIADFEKKTGAAFWMLYGQTETSGLVSFSPASEKPGSAGQIALLSKVRLADADDRTAPPGDTGEITVQGPLVFQGFWKQDESNRFTFRGGWHHTGDLGQIDTDGYLWFRGRKPEKELIKPGGENVYPAEVEAVILEHPAVAEASVIGVPDPKFGEGVKAVCVLKPGQTVAPEALSEFVASRIARYKKPKYIEFVEALPRKADGVIDREQVKGRFGK